MARFARRRRIALVAFVLASGAAHALVGSWLFRHHTSLPPGPGASIHSIQVVSVLVDERAKKTEPPAPPTVEVSPPTLRLPAPAAVTAQATTRYFDASELDQEARPIPDWSVDAPGLYGVGLRRAVMQVFVSDEGRPVRCVLESAEPDSLTSLVKESLERQICSTSLSPAMRGGVPVASVRRIELLLAP